MIETVRNILENVGRAETRGAFSNWIDSEERGDFERGLFLFSGCPS